MKHNNIYNKVKTLAVGTALASLSAGMFSSCSDFLEVEPQNLITLEKFWNQKSDVENTVSGCYEALASYNTVARILMWGEFRSENIISNGTSSDESLKRVLREDINASNNYTTYSDFYTVINRCNTVIKYAPQVAENDPSYTQSQLQAHIAEVTAIRSLCYFYLIRTFAPPQTTPVVGVPYTEEPFIDDSQTLELPPSDFNTILDKLIASLESVQDMAVTRYSGTSDNEKKYSTGRITRGAIWAMLCEMYLWKQDYDKCIYYADKIIQQKNAEKYSGYETSDFTNFYGMHLIPSAIRGKDTYGGDFNKIFVAGNSDESIFEITYVGDKSQLSNNVISDWYGNASATRVIGVPSNIYEDASKKSFQVFLNDKDVRGFINFSTGNAQVTKLTCNKDMEVTDGGTVTGGGIYDKTGSNNPNKSNVIIYRLSDIMLLKAEAYAQKMSDADKLNITAQDIQYGDSVFKYVDAVNRRSLMEKTLTSTLKRTSYDTKEDLTNLVYEERERELMFEGKRYYDLVRRSLREGNTTYLANIVSKKDSKLTSAIKNKMAKLTAIFWPLNLDEMKANPLLNQNDAFGTGESTSVEKSY